MISTVTTTTVTSVYTVASLGLIISLVLLGLLIPRELLSVHRSQRGQALAKVLSVAITPLLIGFGFLMVLRIMDVLQ